VTPFLAAKNLVLQGKKGRKTKSIRQVYLKKEANIGGFEERKWSDFWGNKILFTVEKEQIGSQIGE